MDTRITFKFTKTGSMKYISHLDLMRLFTRAFRRADLPLKITAGFNPHPKLSITKALKLGVEGFNQEASVLLKTALSPQEFTSRMEKQLPEGIKIEDAERNFY